MNTKPDEQTLALWLDDELTGDAQTAVDSWAQGQTEQLAAREQIRQWRTTLPTLIPATEEPPYPDFFNRQIAKSILETAERPVTQQPSTSIWQRWLMPLAACAGMALTFWAGTRATRTSQSAIAETPKANSPEQMVYTPENGVKAELISSSESAAMVIVLDGVKAIPDSVDFAETAGGPTNPAIDSTAEITPNPESKPHP